MHQGTNYRYASWQPINTGKATIGTKPPYYGNIAVAAMVSPGDKHGGAHANVSIHNIPLPRIFEAAYATYANGTLARIAVINMFEYNYTTTNSSAPGPRPSSRYSFSVPGAVNGTARAVKLQRLMANGSDAISGVTFDGYSYNYELDEGRPVRLWNVTRGETVRINTDGLVSVDVPDSSAAILSF